MFRPFLFLHCLLVLPCLALPAQEVNRLEPIAPFLDAQTFAVARVDLARIDAAAILQHISRLTRDAISPEELKTRSAQVQGFLATLREYGVQDIYSLVSIADIPENLPPVLLTLKPGANEALIVTHLNQLGKLPWEKHERLHNVLVCGSPATLERLKKNRAVLRPDLQAALAASGDVPVQLAAALPADVQRVVKELVGKLPPEIGGGQGQDLLDALQWTSVGIQTPPKLSLQWLIQSKDEASAAGLRPRILAGLNLLGQQAKLAESMPDFAEVAIRLTPSVKGNRLELAIANDEAEKMLAKLTAGPFSLMRQAATKSQSMNNFKQIALAMHNYHDVHGAFPPAASLSKDGKPLLSWRVHILPYLEQAPLYQQFKLDEPWDSEHNRKLIAQMPPQYNDPAHANLAKDGKTTYVVPVGEKTIFDGKVGTKISKILDGTSNTVLVVDVIPENAVIWSKPDDWNFLAKDPGVGLLGGKREQFLAAFGDGSVRTLPTAIDLGDLRRLMQKDDGEVLSKQY